jgi:hypothetical protein
MDEAVQLITILGLAVCLGMLFLRAKAANTRPASSTNQRLKTAHMLLIALAVWLVVSFNLQHLNGALGGGQPERDPSTWERIVRFLAGENLCFVAFL